MSYVVLFMPSQQMAAIEDGETLLTAAERAGVYVNSICGGEGLCGKCQLILQRGQVDSQPTALLTRDEIRQGYVLACQTRVHSDVVVEVPPESQLEGRPQLVKEEAIRFGGVAPRREGAKVYEFDPLCQKQLLEMSPPTLHDNLADRERVFRVIRQKYDYRVMQTGLFNLQHLASLLRENDWRVTATLGQRGGTLELVQLQPGDESPYNYGVAVDIGTTTVSANLVDLVSGEILGTEACYNSQMRYGEDVISRIIYTAEEGGLERLGEAVSGDINTLVLALVEEAGVALHDVTYMVVVGNTTMIHFLLRMDPKNIRREPYIPTATRPPVVRATEVGITINGRGLLCPLPGVGAYVGSDVTADVLSSGMSQDEELALLFDMGTNGEVVLGNGEWLICCSASAGPAFEGGGMQCGMRATEGAIERVAVTPGDRIVLQTIGGARPRGICGSGLIDLVAELFRADYIDKAGRFQMDGRLHVREGEDSTEFVLVPAERSGTGQDVVVTEPDIAIFVRSKGAIYTAAETLLAHLGLSFEDVERVYISGGFGNYLDIANAITIGLLPDLPRDHFHFIGNGALAGARMALVSREALEEVERITSLMTYFDLSTDPKFMRDFTRSLFIPHTDVERFPSIVR
jgi:uncharacterized 2Fe-2S/4Fe-4S cluster protein (DUF4445 family)